MVTETTAFNKSPGDCEESTGGHSQPLGVQAPRIADVSALPECPDPHPEEVPCRRILGSCYIRSFVQVTMVLARTACKLLCNIPCAAAETPKISQLPKKSPGNLSNINAEFQSFDLAPQDDVAPLLQFVCRGFGLGILQLWL